MIWLGQEKPGDWYIYTEPFHKLEPIPVPSWIVESCGEDKDILALELARIFGMGRKLGKSEGKNEIQERIKLAIGVVQ